MPFFVECNLEAGSNQYTFMLGGDEMLCAPGTIFNLTECACVHDPNPYTRTNPIVIVVRKLVSVRVSLGVDNCQLQTDGKLYKLCHMLFHYHHLVVRQYLKPQSTSCVNLKVVLIDMLSVLDVVSPICDVLLLHVCQFSEHHFKLHIS